jgi:recombination protein U
VGVAFDAKETALNSLPLQNVHEHQIEFMRDINEQGGLAFLIVHFKFCDEYFLIPYEWLAKYVKDEKRRSIPYKEMPRQFEIAMPVNGILNYLPALNAYVSAKALWQESGDIGL